MKVLCNVSVDLLNVYASLACVCFVFAIEVPRELCPLSFHTFRVDMHVSKTKFERNSSLECHQMTYIGKTKHTT